MTQYFVVLIETAGNQRTIFQTNRQRESLGASELIYQVGTGYVLDALGHDETVASDPTRLDAFLVDRMQNPRIEDNADEDNADERAVEILIATSGKAILVVRDRKRGEEIVAHVTRRAVIESPGVTVSGAVVESERDTNGLPSARQLDDAIYRAHQRHEELAALLPSGDLRFPRLPFVEDCVSSGLPAAPVWDKNEGGALAEPFAARRNAHDAAWKRMSAALETNRLTRRIQDLEGKGYTWTAVVHADGNGLGGIFLDFATHAGAASFRDYIEKLRRFSLAIDECTRKAALQAMDATWPAELFEKDVPLIPLVLGGDDLTVLCDGGRAIAFTTAFLRTFEEETRKSPPITCVAPEGLSACAGIAIVKPHFPFHRAYELAEDLIKKAKMVKDKARLDGKPMPCSAFDFQIVFDTSVSDLKDIRDRMTARDGSGTSLTFRPYVVSDAERIGRLSGKDWLALHHFDRLMVCKDLLMAEVKDDGSRDGGLALPRGQQHALRWALGEGKDIADARLEEIRHRYPLDWNTLAPHGTLLVPTQDGASTYSTYLVDAMDLADLEAAAVQPEGGR
jgi:hypothetical protein